MGTTQDLKAEVQLADGRRAMRNAQGRYRDSETGRWIAKGEVERVGLLPDDANALVARATEDVGAGDGLQAAQVLARRHLLETVRQDGHAAQSSADAWGKLVGVQAEIALDKDMGSKATAAAKLVAAATGMLPISGRGFDEAGPGEGIQLNIGATAAARLLDLIAGERAARGTLDDDEEDF